MSRTPWRISAWLVAGVLGAIALTLGVILAQPDARRAMPLWADEFDTSLDGWVYDPREVTPVEGRTRLMPPQPGSTARALHAVPAADFDAETRARAQGVADDGYGFVVGGERERLAFLVSSDGYFSVMRADGDGWIDVQPWRQWPHVRRGGAFNTLRLECAGDTCAFFVNEEVTALVEAAAERDAIGVMAWRYSEEVLQIEVEYLRVWAQAG